MWLLKFMFILYIGESIRFWKEVLVNLKLLILLNFSWDKFVRFWNGFVNVNLENVLIFRCFSVWSLDICKLGYFKFWKLFWWIWRIWSFWRKENVLILILVLLRFVKEIFKLYKFDRFWNVRFWILVSLLWWSMIDVMWV